MSESSKILYVGLDVHKESIAVASAPDDRGAEVVSLGAIGTRQSDIDKLIRTLQSKGAATLVFVYEAGPSGYGLYRYLTGKGFACHVVAPSNVRGERPRRAYASQRSARQRRWAAMSGQGSGSWLPSVNDPIRAQQKGWRDRQTERLRSLEIEHELESGGLFDRKIGGPGALEDLVDIDGGSPDKVATEGSVGDEPTALHILPQLVHDGQPILRREGNDPVDVTLMDGVGGHQERGGTTLLHCTKRRLELFAIAHLDRLQRDAE